jgi:hypothetical protein
MSCKCPTPLVFDVVTKQCVKKCTGSALCLDCSQIPYTAGSAVKLDTKLARAAAEGEKIGAKQYPSTTNYGAVRGFMCPCITDYIWDSTRIACISVNVY